MAYNPGNSDMSGQLLMQGISNMGQGLGGGIEKMMLEKKRKEEELKFAHSIRDSFAKMEKGHELLGYGSKDEMWADSLSNTLSRVNAQKVAGALKSIGLQERGDKARVSMAEGDAAAHPAKLQQASDLAALQKAIMQNSLDASKADADAKSKALAARGSFLKSMSSNGGMSLEQRLSQAVGENPEVFNEHNRDFVNGVRGLFPEQPTIVEHGGSKFIKQGNTLLPIRGNEPTAKDAAELELTKAKTDLTRSKMTAAIDTLAPMQAQADVLDQLKRAGEKYVNIDGDGNVTSAKSNKIFDGTPIDDAINMLRQKSAGKVKFSSGEAPQSSSEMIKVTHPDGRSGMIPKDKLEGALKAGFKKL